MDSENADISDSLPTNYFENELQTVARIDQKNYEALKAQVDQLSQNFNTMVATDPAQVEIALAKEAQIKYKKAQETVENLKYEEQMLQYNKLKKVVEKQQQKSSESTAKLQDCFKENKELKEELDILSKAFDFYKEMFSLNVKFQEETREDFTMLLDIFNNQEYLMNLVVDKTNCKVKKLSVSPNFPDEAQNFINGEYMTNIPFLICQLRDLVINKNKHLK